VIGAPLFVARALEWDAPDDCDALLLGSAQALRHGGPRLASLTHLPVYAVGSASAAAARAMRFTVVATGEGDLQSLAARIDPAHCRLLRLAGQERTEFTPPPYASVIERAVYAIDPLPIGAQFAEALTRPAVIALHSPAAARYFAGELARLEIAQSTLAIAALSPAVATAAGDGWGHVAVAPEVTDGALLALAARLCHLGTREWRRSSGGSQNGN
jgi:uroporphyrinogen-III synthase